MRAASERAWPVGLLAVVAFFLMGAAWAAALPVNGTYDENQHIVRAYAVVTGQWLPDGHAVDAANLPAEAFDGPRSLLPENSDCTWLPKSAPPRAATCLTMVTDRSHTALPSQAARYSPVYYLLVGTPLLVSPDETGVVLVRLLSALLSALLLAGAVMIAYRLGNRLLLAGIVLVSTPLAMNLYGAVNPNGLEISAGVLLFTALLALLRATDQPSGRFGRHLLATAGVASFLLVTARGGIGPALLAGVVAACLLVARPGRIRAVLSDRIGLAAFAGPAACAIGFYVFWFFFAKAAEAATVDASQGRGFPSYGVGEILRRLPGERFRFYAEQIVARFSYGETTVSPLVIVGWYTLVIALVGPALWFGGTRLRLAIAGVFAACLAVLVAFEVFYVPTFGWFSHSRYIMPLGVGVVLLSAFSDRFTAVAGRRGWLGLPLVLLAAATIPFDLYALFRVMARFELGIDHGPLGVFTSGSVASADKWHPVFGSLPPIAAMALGTAGVVAIAALFSRSPVTNPAEND